MACGSVAQSEGAINLATLNLTRCDLTSSTTPPDNIEGLNRTKIRYSVQREDVHEAILFLQKQHEQVLSGLHEQVEQLQQKCDDLQFEAHLKHINSNEEDQLRKKVAELNGLLEEKTNQVALANQRITEVQKAREEERQQHRWKEVKLQQQLEVSDQRTLELKGEVARLKGQVHDLKVFSSALRTGSSGATPGAQRQWSSPKASLVSPKTPLAPHRTSQESLDSLGPRSLGSEEGDVGMWREARLGSGGGKLTSLRGTRTTQGPPQSGTLPPLSPSPSVTRPLSSVSSLATLPPISKRGTRPHVRRQLRLLSAPNLDFPPKSPRKPP